MTAEQALLSLEQTVQAGDISRLPVWGNFSPDAVRDGVQLLLKELDQSFTELEQTLQPDWAGLMLPLQRLQARLGQVLGAVSHLLSVKYDDDLQDVYDALRPEYVKLGNRMSQSRALYDGLCALRDSPVWSGLSVARKRVVEESIRDMERSGVDLEGEPRERYQEIQQQLAELSNRFQTNLVKEEQASRLIIGDADAVSGIPPQILAMAAETARQDGVEEASGEHGPWHFVVNAVNYMAIIQQCEDRSTRESAYRAFRRRGMSEQYDNRPVLEEILRLRQQSAALVGFSNYAELSLDDKMAGSTDSVMDLLQRLEHAARPAAEREFAALKAFIRSEGMRSEDAPDPQDPQPWDIPFWIERLREHDFSYDGETLRDYFQLPRVMDGLFQLTERLYGVQIRRSGHSDIPVWDDSVEFYDVLREGKVIAGFFMDPYARPGEKRAGAWMNTVVDRSSGLFVDHPRTLPVALFVMNARPPEAGKPALLSLEEVRTLFHEFGHATQHMFTEVDEIGAAGMNLVEWDAVELASQFNEYWMDHKPFLRALTAHCDTDEPLDDDTLEQVISSRNFMGGNTTLRQLVFAITDMTIHQHYRGDGDNQTPFEMEREVVRRTAVLPALDDETQLPSFGHLFSGGYAAGYYSYKWAEVLAADAFAAFREVGLDNDDKVRDVAGRFRDTVLGLGGSLPAADVFRQFRGRDAEPDALLKEQGLA